MQTKESEIWVGLFIIISLCAIAFICMKVTNVYSIRSNVKTYQITAFFDNIGNLKVRSPVRIGGVIIGRVVDITLDPKTYTPKVTIDIECTYNHIPDNSSLMVRTSGLLGEQYLALNIGFEDLKMGTSVLKDGSIIHNTKPAVILEDLIGRFMYKSGNDYVNTYNNSYYTTPIITH